MQRLEPVWMPQRNCSIGCVAALFSIGLLLSQMEAKEQIANGHKVTRKGCNDHPSLTRVTIQNGSLLRTLYVLCHSKAGLSPRHRLTGEPAGGPGSLEIKTAGDAINVEQFACEVQSGTDTAFHGLEIHFA